MWCKSRFKAVKNKKNDLLWQIIHQSTLSFKKKWGYISVDKCAVCSQVETIEHCFLECSGISDVWNYFAPFLARLSTRTFSISPLAVFSPLCHEFYPALYRYLVAAIIFWIWNARNSYLPTPKIISSIIPEVHLRIQCDTIDRVRHFWSHKDIICSFDDSDKLTMNL